MAQRKFKPRTPSRRQMTVSTFRELDPGTTKGPERSLIAPISASGGRNNNGRTTTYHRGGGHKRRYRIIDFRRDKVEIPGKVASVEYDPNRSANIALIAYADGEKRYILAPTDLRVGASVIASDKADIQPGNCLALGAMPPGTIVHNIELKPGKGGQIVRSAGGSAQLMAKKGRYVQLRLPSGEQRDVLAVCKATVGTVGNADHENTSLGKAGRSRWLGRRPTNRGVTMNPVDHPHGGGEGRTSGGRHPVTPWGKPTRGKKTRKNKRTDRYIVSRASKRKRG